MKLKVNKLYKGDKVVMHDCMEAHGREAEVIPPNTGSHVRVKECDYTREDLDKSYREGLATARELLKDVYKIATGDWNDPKWHDQVLQKAREYISEVGK